MRRIILMDFNFTLVENSKDLGKPWELNSTAIAKTKYRHWLYELCYSYDWEIIVVTSRPSRLAQATVDHCLENCPKFNPMSWHWNYKNGQNAPNSKLTSMQKEVFPIYGTENKFLAIESNEQTRKMWTSLGIKSCRHDDKNLETYLSED